MTSSSTAQGLVLNSGKAAASLDVSVGTVHLIKEFIDDPVSPGGTVTLEFSIFNRSRSDAATNISFTDDLDATLSGLSAVDLPALNVCGDGSVLSGTDSEPGVTDLLTLTGGTVEAGQSCTFLVTLQVPSGATPGGYHNETSMVTADVGGEPTDGNTASDTLFVDVAPLLTKKFMDNDNPVGGGDIVTMEFSFTNQSDSEATEIAFTDSLGFISGAVPLGLPADGFCGPGSSMGVTIVLDAPQLLISGGSLAAPQTCTFSVDLQLPVGTPGGDATNTTSEITATIDGSTRIGSPASDTLTVISSPRFTKEFTDDPVEAGDTVTLEF